MAANPSLPAVPRTAVVDRLPDGSHRFVLQPRCSLTPVTARRFLWSIGGTTFAIAGFFAAHGYWPVLPFAGLEIGLLVWALRASMRAGRIRETILIDEDTIRIELYDPKGSRTAIFPRHWARVTLRAPHAVLHPSRLFIESHGRACEVGRFLTEEERRVFARRLKQLVGNVNESPALK
jgi:uncharacterized membrane protein